MRIPTGNFGNAVPTPQPTRVNVSGTGAIGQAVAGLADDVKQEINAVVRARAGDSMLDYQIKLKDINESIRRGVEDGTLRADQVENVYHDAVGKLEKPQFSGLGIAETQIAEGGLKRYESDGLTTAQGYARAALKIEARDQVDSGLDKLGKLINYPGADIEKINAMSTAYEEQGRLAYGAQWAKVRQSWVDRNWFNQAQQKLMEARDNGAALSDLTNQLTSEKGFYIDKLDPDKRNALLNQAMGYQSRLEAKAAAAEAKREALAARTYNSFAQQVYSDLPTTAEQQERLISATKGTSVEAEVKDLLSDQGTIRKVISAGPAESQNYVNNLYAELNEKGGDMRQWRLAQRLTTAVQKNNKQLMETPLLFNQNRTGDAVTPLDMTALNPTAAAAMSAMDGADISQRFSQQLQERSATLDAISSTVGFKVPHKVLLPQEATYLAGMLKDKTSGQQSEILTRLRNMVPNDRDYKALMQQIYPETPTAALAGSLPSMESTNKVLQGYDQIKGQKGDMSSWDKAKKTWEEEFDSIVGDAFSGRPQARQNALNLTFAYGVGDATQKGNYSTDVTRSQVQDALNKTIGEAITLGGQKVFVPVGVSTSDFKYRYPALLYQALERQGMDVSRAKQSSLFNLVPAGSDGDYIVSQGIDALIDKKGRPLTINLSKATIDGINNAEAAVINQKIKDIKFGNNPANFGVPDYLKTEAFSLYGGDE